MFIISLYCKIMEKQKNTRNIRTLEEKYKIIKYLFRLSETRAYGTIAILFPVLQVNVK